MQPKDSYESDWSKQNQEPVADDGFDPPTPPKGIENNYINVPPGLYKPDTTYYPPQQKTLEM